MRNSWGDGLNDIFLEKSPLIPEYGKVVCVSMSYFKKNGERAIMSYIDHDEEDVIVQSHKFFEKVSNKTSMGLCGYHIKGFDIPWLNRKFLKYGLPIPNIMKTFGVKPWESNIYDLYEIWKNYGSLPNVSLNEVLYELRIDGKLMDGSDVHDVYWKDKNLDKIKEYCEYDVDACIKISEKIMSLI
ncbi:MAG: ribonuclease H-like domain-containing protein [Candidatus Riesia sp.]|nr:ribonuclease H-like domain-containing protein [Candidatus Riesia sp.]